MVLVQFVSLQPSSNWLLLHASCVAVAEFCHTMVSHALTYGALYKDPHWSNYLPVTLWVRTFNEISAPRREQKTLSQFQPASQLKCLEVHVRP